MSTNVSQKATIIDKLNATPATQVANIPEVALKFKSIYAIMNGANDANANLKYEMEKFHFMKLLQDKPELQQCTKLSLYGCFVDMAVNGLSFDPAMKHAYIVAMPTNVGNKDNPKWEKRATLFISGYGELVVRTQQKQIKYADNPVLVFEGDAFTYGTKNGHTFLEHTAVFPRVSDQLMACYLRIERIDGSVDYKVFGMGEIYKLKEFSKQKNSVAWTSGFDGMVQAKTIKHAFRSYPKVRMGNFSKMESETVDTDHEELPVIDYGLGETTSSPAAPGNSELPEASGQFQATMIVTPAAQQQTLPDNAFMQQPAPQASVQFEDDEF